MSLDSRDTRKLIEIYMTSGIDEVLNYRFDMQAELADFLISSGSWMFERPIKD